ncbi:hypothetical protein GCM10028784_05790 [Myceligenerans cantabricum]
MPEAARGHGGDRDEQIRAARRRLGESIIAAARLTPGHVMVWGQFADAPAWAVQTGIYGTSAAVVMLAARGRDMVGTVRLLPGVAEPSAAEFDTSDLFITHKASAVVDALSAVRFGPTRTTAAYLSLASGVIDGQGWGHHVVPDEPEDPSVLATAHALIALSGVDEMDARMLEGPVAWLGSRVLDDGPLGMLELAFAVIALARLRHAGIGPESERALRRGVDALDSWLRQAQGEPIRYEQIHYWVPKPAERRNHYMTFPLQVVAGTALLLAGAPARSRAHLGGLADHLCRAVEADGGLRSTLTERIGVVDAGMVDQFFAAYLAAQPSSTRPRRVFGRLLRARWLHRAIVFLVLVVAAFWSWRVAAGEDGAMLVSSLANIAFALVTGVLGSMAYSRWDRR